VPTPSLNPAFLPFLQGRRIATLATENSDGSIHLTAVWYLFENGTFYVATNSKSRKARNLAARPKASLMIDSRNPGTERGVTAAGACSILTSNESHQLNHRLHAHYLSPTALSDPQIGGVFTAIDDVTLKITPTSWFNWDMSELDAQVFAGKLAKTPGCILPID
jgi:PPOX class probable F420-dependent enzyme